MFEAVFELLLHICTNLGRVITKGPLLELTKCVDAIMTKLQRRNFTFLDDRPDQKWLSKGSLSLIALVRALVSVRKIIKGSKLSSFSLYIGVEVNTITPKI